MNLSTWALRLQWGHGIAAVESESVEVQSKMDPALLQWGHGIAAVESRMRTRSNRSRMSSFNGATALLPWNPPGFRSGHTRAGSSFNGATALLPWNPWNEKGEES